MKGFVDLYSSVSISSVSPMNFVRILMLFIFVLITLFNSCVVNALLILYSSFRNIRITLFSFSSDLLLNLLFFILSNWSTALTTRVFFGSTFFFLKNHIVAIIFIVI